MSIIIEIVVIVGLYVICLKGVVFVLYFNLILLYFGGRFGVLLYNFCNNL